MQGSNSCQTQKKMSFKSHVYFEPVRPRIVRAALDFLQRVNSLFCDPLIRDGNINHIIYSFLRIWSHLLKKSLMENFIFCVVKKTPNTDTFHEVLVSYYIWIFIEIWCRIFIS